MRIAARDNEVVPEYKIWKGDKTIQLQCVCGTEVRYALYKATIVPRYLLATTTFQGTNETTSLEMHPNFQLHACTNHAELNRYRLICPSVKNREVKSKEFSP